MSRLRTVEIYVTDAMWALLDQERRFLGLDLMNEAAKQITISYCRCTEALMDGYDIRLYNKWPEDEASRNPFVSYALRTDLIDEMDMIISAHSGKCLHQLSFKIPVEDLNYGCKYAGRKDIYSLVNNAIYSYFPCIQHHLHGYKIAIKTNPRINSVIRDRCLFFYPRPHGPKI